MTGKGATDLSLEERMEIQKYLSLNCPTKRIASILGRSNTCIKFEITRGGGRLKYNANTAHNEALDRKEARRRKIRKNIPDPQLQLVMGYVDEKKSINWISKKIGLSCYKIKSLLMENAIKYKRKNYAGVEERLCALEFQIDILTDQLKEIYDRNAKN